MLALSFTVMCVGVALSWNGASLHVSMQILRQQATTPALLPPAKCARTTSFCRSSVGTSGSWKTPRSSCGSFRAHDRDQALDASTALSRHIFGVCFPVLRSQIAVAGGDLAPVLRSFDINVQLLIRCFAFHMQILGTSLRVVDRKGFHATWFNHQHVTCAYVSSPANGLSSFGDINFIPRSRHYSGPV